MTNLGAGKPCPYKKLGTSKNKNPTPKVHNNIRFLGANGLAIPLNRGTQF